MLSSILEAFAAAQSGQVSESRETVADCLVGLMSELVAAYLTSEGKVGAELEHLVNALRNPADPTVQGMGLMQQMTLRLGLEQLVDLKGRMNGQR